jgi:hypothetical protein
VRRITVTMLVITVRIQHGRVMSWSVVRVRVILMNVENFLIKQQSKLGYMLRDWTDGES